MKIDTPSFAFINATYYSDRIIPTLMDGSPLSANQTPSQKTGIKVYGCVLGWILSLFGVAVSLRDAHNRIYFVNKKSLIGWTAANGANQTNTWRDLNLLLHNVYQLQKTNEAIQESRQSAYSEKECGICLVERKFIQLECNHAFCVPCMKEWVTKKENPTCPLDQQELTAQDIVNIRNAEET
jgi:hypothetical protein